MKKDLPYLTYFFILLFLGGFLTLLFAGEYLDSVSDESYPLFAKIASISIFVGLIGSVVEVIRHRRKK